MTSHFFASSVAVAHGVTPQDANRSNRGWLRSTQHMSENAATPEASNPPASASAIIPEPTKPTLSGIVVCE
eukprot:29194-Pelagococcus_subviridis.AAC.1